MSELKITECGLTKRKYSYIQLRKYSKNFAASLLKSGIKPRDAILVVMPNIPEYPIVVLGAIEAGIVPSTANHNYNSDEICHQLKDSNAICVVTYPDKLEDVRKAIAKHQQRTQSTTPVTVISMQNYDGVSRQYPSGVWSLQEMFDNDIDTSIIDAINSQYNVKQEDVVVLPYSSGTTGLNKGVCLTHRNLVSNFEVMSIDEIRLHEESIGGFQDTFLAVIPFYHIYGLVLIVMLGLQTGAKIVTVPKFDTNSYFNMLKEYKFTIFFNVPPLVLFANSRSDVTKDMFSAARYVVCGAAPIGLSDIEKYLTLCPDTAEFKQGYGMTETSPMVTIPTHGNKRLDTIGVVVPSTEVKVVDPESNKVLGPNERGEIQVRGPQVMKCYLNNPTATAATIDAEGWLHSGDIGYYDNNGWFFIVDRIKELIKVKGLQVAPAELEELLRIHPKVADAAVIGIADERSGETPIGYVVKREGCDSVTGEEIMKHVADRVAKHKHITRIEFVDTIPKSPSGKILRRILRDRHSK